MDRPKDRFIHQSAFLFYFFMTAGVLIVAAGSLLQHYFALRHPVFIPMHIELEMYWDGGMDGDTMGSMDGNADMCGRNFPYTISRTVRIPPKWRKLPFPSWRG